MSISTHNTSYTLEAALSNTDADSFIQSKLSKFEWKNFQFGSTYLFLRTSLSSLATDLDKWCELFGPLISYVLSYDLELLMNQQNNLKNGELKKILISIQIL